MTDLSSDTLAGAAPAIVEAVARAAGGQARPYGGDPDTARVGRALDDLFERPLAAFLLANGTAANALALAHLTPGWGTILAHHTAHVLTAESNAPEYASGGAKLVGLPGEHGRIDPEALADLLAAAGHGPPGRIRPTVLSLTQCTDLGTVYTPAEIARLSAIAHDAGMMVHMDGARFANAVAAAGCAPADSSWRAGVDVLSLGTSKGGTMNAEAVLFFDPAIAKGFDLRLRQAGQTMAKSRFLSAQLLAWLEDGRWLALAGHANRMAARLADGLAGSVAVRVRHPVEASIVHADLPRATAEAMAARGMRFAGEPARARSVTSFTTTPDEIDAILAVVAGADAQAPADWLAQT